jgi:uncharacterized protein YcnI
VALASASAPASAHVTLTASTTEAGAVAEVRLEVPHGCTGSATTELAVRMPDGVGDVTATSTERWSAEAEEDAVTFTTDDPLPDALRDEVVLSLRLPDEPGAVLAFPVIQRCEEGESAWTEVAADDASRDQLELPAPVLVVTGTGGDGAAPGDASPTASTMTYGAAGLLAVGCLVSGAVLVLRRRRA